jgi:hypothetical protein
VRAPREEPPEPISVQLDVVLEELEELATLGEHPPLGHLRVPARAKSRSDTR